MKKEMQTKNKSEFYDEDYLKGNKIAKMSLGGGAFKERWDNNGAFYNTAIVVSKIMQNEKLDSVLDVGCGRGWVVRHLLNLGYKAEGCEYGEFAVKNSVCNSVYGDLCKTLPYEYNSFDVITCQGVLSHLPERYLKNAIEELYRITKNVLITNILIQEHTDQWYHLIIEKPDYWKPIFNEAGFIEDKELTKKIREENKFNVNEQWFCIWRKK